MAASSLDNREHVLMSNSVCNSSGILNSRAAHDLFRKDTLVFRKNRRVIDIPPNFIKQAISEQWLFQRIIEEEIPYKPFPKSQPQLSARAKAELGRTQQADIAFAQRLAR